MVSESHERLLKLGISRFGAGDRPRARAAIKEARKHGAGILTLIEMLIKYAPDIVAFIAAIQKLIAALSKKQRSSAG